MDLTLYLAIIVRSFSSLADPEPIAFSSVNPPLGLAETPKKLPELQAIQYSDLIMVAYERFTYAAASKPVIEKLFVAIDT